MMNTPLPRLGPPREERAAAPACTGIRAFLLTDCVPTPVFGRLRHDIDYYEAKQQAFGEFLQREARFEETYRYGG